jgi:Mn2+/Fe2+ NRAMP family transporter
VSRAPRRLSGTLALLGPGLLVAATGVGAGDLLTASLAGSRHGLVLLWAAALGAVLKWFLNEGIARWQLATGTTMLEGWVDRFGPWLRWLFLLYFLPWTFFTGGALISACGVAGTGFLPLGDDLERSKVIWGIAHSLLGLALVWRGGFRVFERVMNACVAVMVVSVLATAILLRPDWSAVLSGLVTPRVPEGGTGYTLGILGGVGGTVTILSYGYWIREKGRAGVAAIRDCRIDLASAYALTGFFGLAMIVIGSRVELRQGPTAALELAGQLALTLGPAGKWIFLSGFWAAVFTSVLGVWQGVPYLFADLARVSRRREATVRSPSPERERGTGGEDGTTGGVDLTVTRPYRTYLVLIALVPIPLLWLSLEQAQLAYTVFASLFMPFLAATLLVMNTRRAWVGPRFRSGWVTNAALAATLGVFTYAGVREATEALRRLF